MEATIRSNAKVVLGDRYHPFEVLVEVEGWLEMSNEDNVRLQDEGAELGGMLNGVGGDEGIVAATGSCVLRWVYTLLALKGINRAMAS